MADRFDFTPPNWVNDEGQVMVWDSSTRTYKARDGSNPLSSPGHGDQKPVEDLGHAGGGDSFLFDPAQMNEQPGNPMFEGWMAHTAGPDDDFGHYVEQHQGDVGAAQQRLFEDLQQQGMGRDAAWRSSLEYRHNWEQWNPTHHQLERYPDRYQPGAEPRNFGEAPERTDMSQFEQALPGEQQTVPPCPNCRSNALRPSAVDGDNDYFECGICHHQFLEDADDGQMHDMGLDEQGMESFYPDMSDLESIPETEHPLGPHTGAIICPECQQPQKMAGGRCHNCGHIFDAQSERNLNTDFGPFNDVEPKEDFAHMDNVGVPFGMMAHWTDHNPLAEMQQRPEDMIGQNVTLDGMPATVNGHGSEVLGEVRAEDGSFIPASWVYIDKRLREHGGQFVSKVSAETLGLGDTPVVPENFNFADAFKPGVKGGKQETHRFVLDPAHNMYIAPATMDHSQIVKQNGIQEFARGSVYGNGTAEVNLQRMPGQINRGTLEQQLQAHVGTPVNLTYMPQEQGGTQETAGHFMVHGEPGTAVKGGGYAWRKQDGVPPDELTQSVPLVFVAEHAETTDYPIYTKCRGGFITATGGTVSHAATVARQSNQPCLVGIGADYNKIAQGASVSIDGQGSAQVGPPNAIVQQYMERGDQDWANATKERQRIERGFNQQVPEWQRPNRGGSVNRPEEQPYEIVDGEIGSRVSATLDECPECRDPMFERDNQKLCGSCGHRQQIMYASNGERIAIDLNPIDLAGKGLDFAQEHPWETAALVGGAALAPVVLPAAGAALGIGAGAEAAGAVGAGEVAADTAAETAGVGGIRGAMKGVLNKGQQVGQAGYAAQGVGQVGGIAENAAGMTPPPPGQDYSAQQGQLAKVRAASSEGMWDFDFDPRYAMDADEDDEPVDIADDDDDEHEPQECPMCGGPGVPLGSLGKRKHYRCRNCGNDFSHQHHESKTGDELEPGGSRDDGDDETEEGTEGARLQHGDETEGESLRDVGDTGSANSGHSPEQQAAIEAFHAEPTIIEFKDSPESGRGHEGVERVLDMLAKAFPGIFDDLLADGPEAEHADSIEGESAGHEPEHHEHEDSGSDESDSKLGGNMTAAGIPGWSGAPNYEAPDDMGGGGEGSDIQSLAEFLKQQGYSVEFDETGGLVIHKGGEAGNDVTVQQTPTGPGPAPTGPDSAVQGSRQAAPHRAPNDEHHTPESHPWVTADGQKLEAGKRYMMKPNGYSVPDDITVDQVGENEIRFTVHGTGMDFPDTLDRQEFDNQGGFSFELKADAPENVVNEVEQREQVPAMNEGQDAGTADPAQQDNLADLPTPVSHEDSESVFDHIPEENIEPSGDGELVYRDPSTGQEMDYQQYAAHLAQQAPEDMQWLWEDKTAPEHQMSERERGMMMATAGRNFTPQQQKEFIQEPGEARNLSKLQLEGTHYTEHDGSSVDPDECWF